MQNCACLRIRVVCGGEIGSPRQETTRQQRELRLSESRKTAFELRIAARISLPRTVRGISPSLQPMELVFSQRADSNRDEPANAQDQSRDCTTAAGLAQSISDSPI